MFNNPFTNKQKLRDGLPEGILPYKIRKALRGKLIQPSIATLFKNGRHSSLRCGGVVVQWLRDGILMGALTMPCACWTGERFAEAKAVTVGMAAWREETRSHGCSSLYTLWERPLTNTNILCIAVGRDNEVHAIKILGGGRMQAIRLLSWTAAQNCPRNLFLLIQSANFKSIMPNFNPHPPLP